jgi:hypothetical protein
LQKASKFESAVEIIGKGFQVYVGFGRLGNLRHGIPLSSGLGETEGE